MPKNKISYKIGVLKKKHLSPYDSSIQKGRLVRKKKVKKDSNEIVVKTKEQVHSGMFLSYNTNLGPPYNIILDTNYINFSLKNHLDLFESIVQCLDALCHLWVTDCVVMEILKMGERYRVALKAARDPRIKRLNCHHKGYYADDCIVRRVTESRCYIVATCDKELRGRIRNVPGVPLLSIKGHSVEVGKMPDCVRSHFFFHKINAY